MLFSLIFLIREGAEWVSAAAHVSVKPSSSPSQAAPYPQLLQLLQPLQPPAGMQATAVPSQKATRIAWHRNDLSLVGEVGRALTYQGLE